MAAPFGGTHGFGGTNSGAHRKRARAAGEAGSGESPCAHAPVNTLLCSDFDRGVT